MSGAMQCDRCASYTDFDALKGAAQITILTLGDGVIPVWPAHQQGPPVDLCAECHVALLAWIKGKRA